jgi:hypothetical protein
MCCKRVFLPILLVCAPVLSSSHAALKINEFMASNTYTQLSPDRSDFEDWIEIYNSGDTPVDMGGLFLTDDLDTPQRWQFPPGTMIQPKGFIVVWADGKGEDLHASFKLAESGEAIGLFLPDGTVIDAVTYGSQLDDISYGRYPDGGEDWHFFAEPTCGQPNTRAGVVSDARTSRQAFSPEGGLYPTAQLVALTADGSAVIHYTLDGSLPTSQSPRYGGPISVATTTCLRARAFRDGMLPSKVETHSYIINEPSTLPVICISTPPEFLFDEDIGITVGIPVSDELGADPPFDPNANFWHKWERPIHLEYYEADGERQIEQDAGIRIFGGFFGRQIRQKAFSIYARNRYGDGDFDYPLFESKPIRSFRQFLLRCSSNDFNRTYIRDAMMSTLVQGRMDVDLQAYEPALVYINGVFWGLYNIREKTNETWPEHNFGVDEDDVDMVEGVGEVSHGDGSDYESLIEYLKTYEMAVPEHYEYVKTQMDVNEFMNYFITELYVRNHDWLHQNIKCWREHRDGAKWRWILYDMDWGFGGEVREGPRQYETNSIQWALDQGEASVVFRQLMQNTAFKQEFAQRFAAHLNTTFDPARVHGIIDTLVQRIAPDMPRQMERWGAIPTPEYWNGQLDVLHEFAENRPFYVFQHLQSTLGLDGTAQFSAEVSDPSAGWITVHDVRGPTPLFRGRWFKGIPLRIQAHANDGWRFVRWEGSHPSQSDRLTLTLNDTTWMLAVFEPAETMHAMRGEM